MASETSGEFWGDQLPGYKATAVNIERHETYGDPTPNMEMFAGLLAAFFGIPVSAEDASMVMILLKVMREKQSGYRLDYEDNRVDISGWDNVLHQVVESHAKQATS